MSSKNRRAKITKPKVAFHGKIFTIKVAKAIYPSGTVKSFEYLIRTPSVGVCAFDARGRILLTREYREGDGRTIWRIPGGRIDKGETPKQAAQRELQEEIGYRARGLKQLGVSRLSVHYQYRAYLYLATNLVHDPLPQEEGEEIRVVPTPLSKAYQMAMKGDFNDLVSLGIIRLYHKARKVGLKRLLGN